MEVPVYYLGKIHKNAIVSRGDYENLIKHNWVDSSGYPRTSIDGFKIYMHQFIKGEPPDGFIIDHIDIDKYNNTRENLRFATIAQNILRQMNSGTPKNSLFMSI